MYWVTWMCKIGQNTIKFILFQNLGKGKILILLNLSNHRYLISLFFTPYMSILSKNAIWYMPFSRFEKLLLCTIFSGRRKYRRPSLFAGVTFQENPSNTKTANTKSENNLNVPDFYENMNKNNLNIHFLAVLCILKMIDNHFEYWSWVICLSIMENIVFCCTF